MTTSTPCTITLSSSEDTNSKIAIDGGAVESISLRLKEDEMKCLDSSIHLESNLNGDGEMSPRKESIEEEEEELKAKIADIRQIETPVRNCTTPGSTQNSSGLICRICHDGDSETDPLISPCSCTGSCGLFHRACIEKWLSTANQDTCEICRQKYLVSRHSKPFKSWLLTPAVGDDQRNLLGDTVCFLLLTPLTSISAYLCASGAVFYFKQVKTSEAVGLICLASLLVFIYLTWLLLTVRYHCQVWFKWRVNNQDIRLLDVSTNRPKAKYSALSPGATKNGKEEVQTASKTLMLDRSEASKVDNPARTKQVEIIVEEEISNSSATDITGSSAKKVLFQDNKSYETSTPDQAPRLGSLNPVDNDEISRITPLSPIVISSDPQADKASVVVSSTADSDIYATLSRNRLVVSPQFPCPWMPEMRSHLLTIGSGAKVGQVKSRGTFSPNVKTINSPFSTKRSNQAYEKL